MMDEDDLLAALDRRAAAAVQALDQAVEEAPIPAPAPGTGSSHRRWLAAAVAAALVVVALVAAGIVVRDDEQGTIAGEPHMDDPAPLGTHTQLGLPDPGSLGYRVAGAFPAGDTATGTFDRPQVTVTVQVPDGADEPWPVTVVEYALPSNLTTLSGEPVDIGGPEATVDPDAAAPTVGWIDGDRVRYLMSHDTPVGELVFLAAAIVATGTEPGAPLPGHEIVHTGPFVDVFPMLGSNSGSPSGGISGIVYESDLRGFVVGTTQGSPARWRAAHALAHGQQIEVRGRPAVLAEFGGGIVEVSWLEADGTLVRVDSAHGDLPIDLLDRLEPITDDEFEALVERFGAERDPAAPDTGPDEGASETQLARVETEIDGVTISASVLSGGRRDLALQTFTEGPTGGTGTGQTLDDLSTNIVVRDVIQLDASDHRGTLLAGLIGADVRTPRVVDATTGEEITAGTGPLLATIDGSNQVLFLATLPAGYEARDLAVAGTSPTGEEVRLEAPAP